MLGRVAAMAALAALAVSCAGLEPAGRNAGRAPEAAPPPVASAPAPRATPAPSPAAPTSTPSSAAPEAAASNAPLPPAPAPTAPPPAAASSPEPERAPVNTRSSGNDVVVPGMRERQVPAPNGDPRSTSERMQDINAWDRCVTTVQSAFERDPMRPQLQSPEEYCSQSLGMADRDAIPLSRQQR